MSKDIRPVAIIGAMDAEIDQYLKHFKVSREVVWNYFTFRLAKLGDKDAVIVKSGVGKVFAAMICERLIDELKGDAIEMEGGAVAQVCTLNRVPFLIVRTVSDRVDGTGAEDFNKFMPVVAKNSYKVVSTLLRSL